MNHSLRRAGPLTKNRGQSFPVRCVWFDCETLPVDEGNGVVRHELRLGWACYRRRHRNNRWSDPEWFYFETGSDLWRWIASKAPISTRLNVLAHNAGYDWTASHAWSLLPGLGWDLTWSVLDSPPFIVRWRHGKRTIYGLDTLNFWRIPLAKIGAELGLEKLDMPLLDAPDEEWSTYCRRDVEIIMEASLSWWYWLMEHNLGSAAPTIASQAFIAFRHSYMSHEIYLDGSPKALSLARRAYHGGRVECWSLGRLRGTYSLMDVNSMYPWVMLEHDYPTKLVGVYGCLKPERLERSLKELCAVADVTVETSEPVYPLYVDGRLIFPTGTFRTALSTPELSHALEYDRVVAVHDVALYEKAPIFKRWVEDLYRLREQANTEGNEWEAWVCKRLMNSLYGKFGQRGYHAIDLGTCDIDDIRAETLYSERLGKRVRCRWMSGRVVATWSEGEAKHSHPAIAAEVTSWARLALWSFIERAGFDHVHYMDTDSVLVDADGFERLADSLHKTRLGALDVQRVVNDADLRGPKDYRLEAHERIKGVKRGTLEHEPNLYIVETWSGMRGMLARGQLDAPRVRTHTKRLKRIYRKGVVQPSGRVLPFELPADEGRWRSNGIGQGF